MFFSTGVILNSNAVGIGNQAPSWAFSKPFYSRNSTEKPNKNFYNFSKKVESTIFAETYLRYEPNCQFNCIK